MDYQKWRQLRSFNAVGSKLFKFPSGEIAVFGSYKIEILNPYTGNVVKTLLQTGDCSSLAYIRNKEVLVSTSGNTITLWNLTNSEPIKSWEPNRYNVQGLYILANGDLINSGADYYRPIKIWDTKDDFVIKKAISINGLTSCQIKSLLPNGNLVISDPVQATTYVVDPNNNWAIIKMFNPHIKYLYLPYLHDVLAFTNGDFATSGSDNNVKIWSGKDYSLKRILTNVTACYKMINLPNNHLACGSDLDVHIFNLETGENVKTLYGDNGQVLGLTLLDSGELATLWSYDNKLKIWGSSKLKFIYYLFIFFY